MVWICGVVLRSGRLRGGDLLLRLGGRFCLLFQCAL